MNPSARRTRLIRLACMALLCMLFCGCQRCYFGMPPPRPDEKNVLFFEQREDYWGENSSERVCYDGSAAYFIEWDGRQKRICRAQGPGEKQVLYTCYGAYEIASWGDWLVVYGQETAGDPVSAMLLDKGQPSAKPADTYAYAEHELHQLELPDGSVKFEDGRSPLRLIFYDSVRNVSFDTLAENYLNYRVYERYPKEKWRRIFEAWGRPIGKEYVTEDGYGWMVRSGARFTDLYRREDEPYKMWEIYILDPAEADEGMAHLWGGRTRNLLLYKDQPYAIDGYGEREYPLKISAYAAPDIAYIAYGAQGYEFRKRFLSQHGRIQYCVFSTFDQTREYDSSHENDVGLAASNKIIAVDLEDMAEVRSLTLTLPREMVLYVSGAGVYTWRHDERRVFLTTWEGESSPASGEIPYTPRYQTEEDEQEGDACNLWYAEVDRGRSRLLLFDRTLGYEALLAMIPVEQGE